MSRAPATADSTETVSAGKRPPIKLRHILLAFLLVVSIVPLLTIASLLIGTNRDILKDQQTELLTHFAQSFAQILSDDLAIRQKELRLFGQGLLAAPGRRAVQSRLEEEWAADYLSQFAEERSDVLAIYLIGNPDERHFQLNRRSFDDGVNESIQQAAREARETGDTVFRFSRLPEYESPAVMVAEPVPPPGDGETLVIVTLELLRMEAPGLDLDELFLIDAEGNLLWTANSRPEIEQALLESDLVTGFVRNPFAVTRELRVEAKGRDDRVLARIVPVESAGWGVVAHKAADVAFQQVQDMAKTTVLISLVAIILAMTFAFLATRWLSAPIQKLAEASHEIASGNFDRRVPTGGTTLEVAELADDFNRMSEYVENYIERLRRAAEANRQLFISSIRAFAAAIDAKDPYTRGHSERVARYSRAIARYLGVPKDFQEKVWISAVLHDIGKIGVEDRVLLKMGRLTDEEFDQMKLHPVIGADIVEPISALRDMLPGIRWHHEAWNGGGYPDQLQGEEIPLMARIIGVADTFDAITTNRPYQTASPPEFALQTIKKLTGTKFDARIVTAFLLAYEAGQIRMDAPQAVSPSAAGGAIN